MNDKKYSAIPLDPTQSAPTTPQTISSAALSRAEDIATEPDQADIDRSTTFKIPDLRPSKDNSFDDLDNDPEIQNLRFRTANPPNVSDEESFVGSAPDVEKIQEEDTLDRAHDMGLQLDDDEENPHELNLAKDFDTAEEQKYT
jgi:hypothetical protein